MLEWLTKLFSGGGKTQLIEEALKDGGIIVDVRTPAEFAGGHPAHAKNIPLNKIPDRAAEIAKWNKPIVVCCASGVRSAQAASILKNKGAARVVDAGGWRNLS